MTESDVSLCARYNAALHYSEFGAAVCRGFKWSDINKSSWVEIIMSVVDPAILVVKSTLVHPGRYRLPSVIPVDRIKGWWSEDNICEVY